MKDETLRKGFISVLNFAKEKINYTVNPNEKFIKYGADNKFPNQLLEFYNSIPEHNSAVDFIESNIIGEGISVSDLDYWDIKKIVLDFLIFGGYTIQIIKQRNNGVQYAYVDSSKCRLSTDKSQVGYSDNWFEHRPTIKWYPLVSDNKTEGIFWYKNTKSRDTYPMPPYMSCHLSLDTMTSIMSYHNNNAKNGFTPNVLINFNGGVPDDKTQAAIEQGIINKFTGEAGQRFVLSFNENKDTETTFQKLENDNLDAKFETLQVFIQNQIIIAHKLTSGTLIGIKPESQGFSKTEYEEALSIFKEVTIKSFQNELQYSLKQLTGLDIKFIEPSIQPNINPIV